MTRFFHVEMFPLLINCSLITAVVALCLPACGSLAVRVSTGNCAVFVGNRIIIRAGADSLVVPGPGEERRSLAQCQTGLLCGTAPLTR